MADRADRATDIAERELETLLARRPSSVSDSADVCIDCGLLIPSERQLAAPGCQRCIDCARAAERGGA